MCSRYFINNNVSKNCWCFFMLMVSTIVIFSSTCCYARSLKRLAMSARQSDAEVEEAFAQASGNKKMLNGFGQHGYGLSDEDILLGGQNSDDADQSDSNASDGAASLQRLACDMLVKELQTASADFAKFMQVYCSTVDASTPRIAMPERCRKSLDEAYELFDSYDVLLQQNCKLQYEELFAANGVAGGGAGGGAGGASGFAKHDNGL